MEALDSMAWCPPLLYPIPLPRSPHSSLPRLSSQYANECGGANAELTRCTDLARVNEDVAKLFATTIPLLMVLFHRE